MRPYPDPMTTDGLGAAHEPLYIFLSRSAIIGVLRSVFRHRFDVFRCLPRTFRIRALCASSRRPDVLPWIVLRCLSVGPRFPRYFLALRPCRCSGPCSPRMPLSVGLRACGVRSIPRRIHALGACGVPRFSTLNQRLNMGYHGCLSSSVFAAVSPLEGGISVALPWPSVRR